MAKSNILKILEIDPYLMPYKDDLDLRMSLYKQKRKELLKDKKNITDFANGYKFFGFHKTDEGWVYREWAPSAEKMYLTGDFNCWNTRSHELKRLENGIFEIKLEGEDALKVGQKVQAIIINNGNELRRIPTYATRVVQDSVTYLWCAEIEDTFTEFVWTDHGFKPHKTPLIYECHIGMSGEEGKVTSYKEFTANTLPRIKELGYNTIQIMAIMEHPYYGSFGYQVSNFFAASSRYGSSADLKELINTAHSLGITVLLDVVHSHAVKNTNEGLNEFDGTAYQFFHEGGKGEHSAWGTKLFNYGKNEVLHFLLSNLKFWMEVFHFDGFRFDGVTSMLYHDHGLGSAFTDYSMYFSMNTDTEAVTYLQLANELIHKVNKNAISIAEDMSGMPGMCIPIKDGGIGFDFRLSMGVPDLWIKTIKEQSDEHWNMGKLWYELTSRRPQEKNIGYCESHDQALVGDKTIMFRLCDAEMYTGMQKFGGNYVVDRGIALHKMIRLLTSSLAGEGYLNFMGNEFGHPEWIDFPREGNGWSYHYCRRQWSLVDNPNLRYRELNDFDKAMLDLLKKGKILKLIAQNRWMHEDDKVLVYTKGDYVFIFNFHPTKSFDGYFIPVEKNGVYKTVLTTDDGVFGGYSRVDTDYKYKAEKTPANWCGFKCYLPNRTAIVLKKIK
ncbi:MAG: alpha amylase C-terminal domain-containing protein [Clostridia bacterium]|nr:alpha amylase C-terminal domain-containing protein [Clostridia bacterium]